jgi:hypothetical protein
MALSPTGCLWALNPFNRNPSLPQKQAGPGNCRGLLKNFGADDQIRTGDPHLGKVMLYQLSHVRKKLHPSSLEVLRPQR